MLRGLLASHLARRMGPNGQFGGTYEPTPDRYTPPTARPVNAALAAYALARMARAPGGNEAERERYAQLARRALTFLIEELDKRPTGPQRQPAITDNLASTAMTLLALLETPGGGEAFETAIKRLVIAMTHMMGDDGQFRAASRVGASDAPADAQALAAAVLVALFDRQRDPAVLDQARAALAVAWKQVGDETAYAAMPWLMMAERTLERLGRNQGGAKQARARLDQLWKTQVWFNADGADDTVGGFTVGTGIIEEPNWHSASVLAAQAMALGSASVVPEADRARWVTNCALGARFIAQLTMQGSATYYVRSRGAAIGGVRAALWDNRQPLAATAMALVALIELQESLERFAAQPQ